MIRGAHLAGLVYRRERLVKKKNPITPVQTQEKANQYARARNYRAGREEREAEIEQALNDMGRVTRRDH